MPARWTCLTCARRQYRRRALMGDLKAYHEGLTMSVHTDVAERLPDVRNDHCWLQHGDSIDLMGDMPGKKSGGHGIRTHNPMINSHML